MTNLTIIFLFLFDYFSTPSIVGISNEYLQLWYDSTMYIVQVQTSTKFENKSCFKILNFKVDTLVSRPQQSEK